MIQHIFMSTFYFYNVVTCYFHTIHAIDKIFRKFNMQTNNFFHTLGWILLSLLSLDIVTVAYIPLRGRSYMELPSDIASKQAIINIQNTDDKCCVWSIIAQLHPAPYHCERVTWYTPYEHELNMQGLYSYIL